MSCLSVPPRTLAAILLTALYIAGLSPLAADASPREGTVAWMLDQPVGSRVVLDTMIVHEVGVNYLLLREPFAFEHVVFVDVSAQVKKWQSVEACGTVALDSSSRKYLADARVYAYTDSSERIILCPLPKPVDRRIMWAGTLDVTSGAQTMASLLSNPPSPPIPETSPTATISGWRTPLAAVKSLPDGTQVEVKNKWVSGWDINGTDYWLEEADRSAGIKLRFNGTPGINDLISCSATVEIDGGQKILVCSGDVTSQPPPSDAMPPSPLGLPNYAVWGTQLETGSNGRTGGTSNIGLLVTVWGEVTATGLNLMDYTTYLALDDGSGVQLRVDLYNGIFSTPDLEPDTGDFVAVTGVADVVDRTSIDGLSWPDGWCRRVAPRDENDITVINQQSPPQGTGRPHGTVTVNLQAGEQIDVPVHVYTQYGHVVVEPNQWSGGSGSYSASCDLEGVPGDSTHSGLLTVKAAGYGSVSKWARPGSSVNVTLDAIAVGGFGMTDPSPTVLTCGGSTGSTLSARVWDDEGGYLPGEVIEFSVTNGVFAHNGLQTALVTADASGLANVRVTPTTGRDMVVTAKWNDTYIMRFIDVASEQLSVWSEPALKSGTTATVYARLAYEDVPVTDAGVTFIADAGGSVNGYSSVTTLTNINGIAQVEFTGNGTSEPKVRVESTSLCGGTQSIELGTQVDVVFVIDRSGSMDGHEAIASVQAFITYMASQMSNIRFGAVMFNDNVPVQSLSAYTGSNAANVLCDWLTPFSASGATTAQVAALSAAALDLETYSPAEARKFVVYITDATIGTYDMQVRLDLVRRLEAVTGGNGGGVFVSLWEDPDFSPTLRQHYSLEFTEEPLYPSIAVNGDYDEVNYSDYKPAPEPRYLFTSLRDRILYGL